MGKTHLGLYVSIDHADLVQVSGTLDRARIDTYSRTQLPKSGLWRQLLQETAPDKTALSSGGTPAETLEQAEAVLTDCIRSLVKRMQPTSPYVHAAIPPEVVVVRYFQMPWLPPQDRTHAVLFEATKYLPYRHEELNKDFLVNYLIRMEKATTAPMRVAFFAVRKSFLSSYLRVVKEAGLIPVSCETVALSLLRILRQDKRLKPAESQILIFIDRDSANITICGNDTLYLSRNMAGAQTAPVSAPAAGGTSGAASDSGSHAANDSEFLEALLNEARVSIDYYRRRFPGEPPTGRVVLVGYKLDKNVADAFSAALNLPVELLEPIQGIQGAEGIPPGLSIAVGLGLGGLDVSRNQLNLLPVEERPILQSLIKPAVMEIAAGVVLLALFFGLSARGTASLEKKVASVRQMMQLVNLSGATKGLGLPELTALRAKKSAEARFLSSLEKNRFDSVAALTRVAKLLPVDGWLTSVLFEGRLLNPSDRSLTPIERDISMKFTGKVYVGEQSQEVQEINRLIDAIRSDPILTASLPSVTLESVKRSRFYGLDATEFQIFCAVAQSSKKAQGSQP